MAGYRKHEAQEWAWQTLKGQWTTLVTPFTPDNQVDTDGLRRNIRHVQSLGVRGGGCTWNMGEFWSLTEGERRLVMDTVADEAAGHWLIGAHVTDTSLRESIALAQHAERRGFDLLIIAPSYMVTKTEDQVVDFVRQVAENTELAIMFYNSPQFGITISPQGLKRLCAIPNVVGVKEASFNQQISIETHLLVGRDAVISTPDEWIFHKAKGTRIPPAGDVRQHLRLAVRHSPAQLLHPVHRPRHRRRPRRGLLQPLPEGHQGAVRQVVGRHHEKDRRRAARIHVQGLGRDDGHGRRKRSRSPA